MTRELSIGIVAAAAALALSACDRPADKTGANESPPRTAQAPDSPRPSSAPRDPAMTPPPPSSPSAMPEKEKRDSGGVPGSTK